ncbi:MAG: bifunctional [glutamate--ammonia ligase]-adenylyl-L-tyrosine phosphorylase/[glutamate--ammonia-ligase] adenylyltransferase, partial [Deltaproteobacteria bacterium]
MPKAFQPAGGLSDATGQAPSPALARGFIERLTESDVGRGLSGLTAERLGDLCFLLGSSPALARRLLARGTGWPQLFASVYDDANGKGPPSGSEAGRLQARLAEHVADEMLRIGGRELLGLAGTAETTAQLSRLAEGVIEVALAGSRQALAAEREQPLDARGRPLGFVVLGLGKLGGSELNYSSDVDLIYLHAGSDRTGSGSVAPFFDQLAKRLTAMLAGTGYPSSCFRVDMRLRPYGRDGPLVCSAQAALDYYQRAGETWERGALIKARPVAGDLELGRDFIERVAPFIYRRHLDYRTAEDLRLMKSRIDQAQSGSGRAVRDVKIGPGGIREIEFVTQLLQLVHGGHETGVRERGTVRALELLEEHRFIGSEQAMGLRQAYGFLRQVEHAVQVPEQRQTHTLPTAPEGLRQLARRLGYGSGRRGRDLGGDEVANFERDWGRHTGCVHEVFLRFHELRPPESGQGSASSDPLSAALFAHLEAGRLRGAADLLEQLGFGDGERAAGALARLQSATETDTGGQRTRAVAAMAPSLVEAAAISSDPQSSLDKLVDFLVRAGAHTSYAALLSGSESAMRILAVLFSSSPYLAGLLVGRPELLDWLARTADHERQPERAELAAEIVGRLAAPVAETKTSGDEEPLLAQLRLFRTGHLVRIGMADLGGAIDDAEVHVQLSLLGEVTLAAALDAARDLLGTDQARGGLGRLDLAVLALGKLGGREMSYGSDLDLIFVYDTGSADYDAGCHALATRWAQRSLALLQTRTRDGIAYQVDTRLRPSGSSGPLVVSLARFAEYHAGEAALWERQAHIKGRVVYGGTELAARIEDLRQGFVYGGGLDSEGVAEIDRMRRRMEAELARE